MSRVEGRRLRVVDGAAPQNAEPTDALLVARAAAGDRAAHRAIFVRYAPLVLHMAMRMLRDRDDAEDVVQETFERALGNLSKLREPGALKSWLVQISVRQVHARFRRRKLLRALGMSPRESAVDVTLESLAARDASPEQCAELAILDHTLRSLPSVVRIAWMLRYVEGLDLADVARACDCSLATVKRRIAAGDAHVRQHVSLASEARTDE